MKEGADSVVDRVESADLAELGDLDIDDVYGHIDALLRELPGPLDLYRRWERQQWAASDVDFSVDRLHWAAFNPFVREELEMILSGFFVGEQAVTDTLAPLLMGAPDEESRWFLSTQVVDEARHAYFFARFFSEVADAGELTVAIDRAWKYSSGPAYRQMFGPGGHLVSATEAVRLDPGDAGLWVEGITVYHLVVEGILALTGQRLVLRLLRRLDLLPGFRAGFTAVTRDESRHVNYGIWALRRAVREGHQARVLGAVDRTIETAMRIYVNPARRIVIPPNIPPQSRQDPRVNWDFAVDSLTRRLRATGIEGAAVEAVGQRARAVVGAAVAEYESNHGLEHPVRAWERGEFSAQ